MARKKKPPGHRPLAGPIFLSLLCLFVWAALVTFDVADWPNPSHYPHSDPAHNACGRVGALVAYQLFYWLGDGAYPLALFSSLAAGLWLVHGKIVRLMRDMIRMECYREHYDQEDDDQDVQDETDGFGVLTGRPGRTLSGCPAILRAVILS